MNGNSWRDQSTGASPTSSLSNLLLNNPKQQPLAFEPDSADSLNDDALVRATISASIRACALSREQIADAMSEVLGIQVTAKMLNNYSATAMQANRFPAAWDRAFCRATSDNALLVCRVLRAGLFVIGAEERDLLELGRQYLLAKRADENRQLLEKRLAGSKL